ncbi:MAG: FtsQ-type POTRA domain-containing protein, partial [Steroidobacteraceae bacterium]|nr:FtsQ-type POTRA domain-containing protein [Steroidobacteraceae bacterium]
MLGLGPRRNRRRATARRWRLPRVHWAIALPYAIGAVLLGALLLGVHVALDRPVERIELLGRFQRVQPLDVEQAGRGRTHGVGLVSVNLAAVRRAIAALPWVDTATVERVWPNGLRVTVVEQVA